MSLFSRNFSLLWSLRKISWWIMPLSHMPLLETEFCAPNGFEGWPMTTFSMCWEFPYTYWYLLISKNTCTTKYLLYFFLLVSLLNTGIAPSESSSPWFRVGRILWGAPDEHLLMYLKINTSQQMWPLGKCFIHPRVYCSEYTNFCMERGHSCWQPTELSLNCVSI